MKNFLSILLFISVFTFSAKAQYVNVPDPRLKSNLMQSFPDCFDGSGMLDTVCAATKTFFSPPGGGAPITNWDGFQYFKNLDTIWMDFVGHSSFPTVWPVGLKSLSTGYSTVPTALPTLPNGLLELNCEGANIISLGSLPNSLIHLTCSRNYSLHNLGTLPTSLQSLACDYDSLATLSTLPVNLARLNCSFNQLTALPALPNPITYINCSNNNLTVLPALPAQLQQLWCENNHLSTLPSLPSNLERISANENDFTSLPALPASLKSLEVAGSLLTALPALPAGLQGLTCYINQLTALPALPATLGNIQCGNNQLTSLPALPDSLTYFSVDGNPLISLPALPARLQYLTCSNCNLYSLPAIPASLQSMSIYRNHITCLPYIPYMNNITMDDQIGCVANLNYYMISVLDANQNQTDYRSATNPYPLCSAINNVNQCDAFPVMTGYVFNDNNNNLIKDANEPYRPNIKVQLSNGAFTFSNSNGFYQLPAPDTGTYTITVTPPNYYTSVPLQYNYHFTTYDTLVTGNFALQATATVDSLSVDITQGNAARPGFAFSYNIAYSNGGTTTLSPNIVFNYDNTRLTYDSSSNAALINTGNSLTLSEPGFVAGQQDHFVAYFTVNPAAVIGDTLRAGAHINGGAAAAADSVFIVIRGSYDPNDKTATPTLFPEQVINGDYINYTIRFQNTGTDTAFNIVITDTLNAFLQPASLQVLNTSHPCKITVKGNAVSFEFLNILLPDSNVNQFKSNGYVSFKVKPQSNLVIGNSIPNKAAIYFDYNSPVITNTAITAIIDPSTVPLTLISFTVHKGPGSTANVYWQTYNELNVNGYNIEMSTDARNYKSIGFEKARGDQYDSYTRSVTIPNNDVLYFRLKMMDIDGNYRYSNIAILRNDKTNTAFSFLNNPAKDELNISVNDADLKNTVAKIYNAQGVLVKTILLQHDVETIDIKSLPAGTYYLVTLKGSRQFIVIK
ncbi:MAG: T9SS type A sorting domain-containing protein [Ferruginibacter sp.]